MEPQYYEEEDYYGETAPRSKVTAILLTALHPSLGYLYVGQSKAATWASLGFLLYLLLFLTSWVVIQFFPLLPVTVFLLGWVVLSLTCLWGILRALPAQNYVLKNYNHPMVYAMVYLFAAIIPAYAGWFASTSLLWSVVQINDETMLPTLQPGDIILVDNLAYARQSPDRGDEVVAQRTPSEVMLGRVVGLPGDTLKLEGDEVFINGEVLPQFLLEEDPEPVANKDERMTALQTTRLLIEQHGTRRYVISTEVGPPAEGSRTLTAEEDQILLLGDNRALTRRSALTPLTAQKILGKPRYILYSQTREPEGTLQTRWDRVGLRIE